MKKILSLILVLALAAALFAGCANTTTGTETGTETTNTDTNSTAGSAGNDTMTYAPETSQQPSDTVQAATTTAPEATPAASPETTPETAPEQNETAPVTIRLGGLKGPTSMGMVKLLDDAEKGETINEYEFVMAGAADELTPKLLKGELDILAVPANLGSILYNNSNGAVQMMAINTLGVIYLVEKDGEEITDWESLKGATVYATGKGSTPEFAFSYLLAQHGLDISSDVTMEWKSEPTEVVATMKTDEHAVALLPQPFVTVAQTQIEGLRVAMSLTEEWEKLGNDSAFITAGLIVRRAFAEENPEALAKFLEEYEASTQFINDNVAEGAALVEKYDIVKAAVAEKAIPFCNIVCIAGEKMKEMTNGYFEVLFGQNPNSLGGKMPADDFYYIVK